MSEPLYLEQGVADLLGLSRRDLKSVRDEVLQKEKGWTVHGRDVALTQTGLDRILKQLRLADRPIDFATARVAAASSEKKAAADMPGPAAAAGNDTEELTVHRTYPNPRLLEALTNSGDRVTVGVKSNQNFRPKMKLRARLVRAGRYELEGRCPRYPGRY